MTASTLTSVLESLKTTEVDRLLVTHFSLCLLLNDAVLCVYSAGDGIINEYVAVGGMRIGSIRRKPVPLSYDAHIRFNKICHLVQL